MEEVCNNSLDLTWQQISKLSDKTQNQRLREKKKDSNKLIYGPISNYLGSVAWILQAVQISFTILTVKRNFIFSKSQICSMILNVKIHDSLVRRISYIK